MGTLSSVPFYLLIDFIKKVTKPNKKNLQNVRRKNKLICGKKEEGIYEE